MHHFHDVTNLPCPSRPATSLPKCLPVCRTTLDTRPRPQHTPEPSYLNSCTIASEWLGSNHFLTATGVPFQKPLYTSEKPPPPIWSCTSRSSYAIWYDELYDERVPYGVRVRRDGERAAGVVGVASGLEDEGRKGKGRES